MGACPQPSLVEGNSPGHAHLCFRQHPSFLYDGDELKVKTSICCVDFGVQSKAGSKVMLFSLLQFFKSAFIYLLSTKVDRKAHGKSLWLAMAASSGWDLLSSVHSRR